MKLQDIISKYPNLRLATQEDNQLILNFFETTAMKGKGLQLSYQRSPDFFKFLKCQSEKYFVIIGENDQKQICGLGTLVIRPGMIQGKKTNVGYLGDLRIKPDKKVAIQYRKFYGDFITHASQIEDFYGCQFFLTAILEKNKEAIRSLVENTKNPFQYIPYSSYKMINIHSSMQFFKTKTEIGLEVGFAKPEELDEIKLFLFEENKKRAYGFIYTDSNYDELNYRLDNWDGLNLSDFVCVKHLGRIVSLCSLWSPASSKKIIVEYMPWYLRCYFFIQSIMKSVPKVGAELKVLYMNNLSFKEELTKDQMHIYMNMMVDFILSSKKFNGYHSLAYSDFEENSLLEGLKNKMYVATELRLYIVKPRELEFQVESVGKKPPGFEMSLV